MRVYGAFGGPGASCRFDSGKLEGRVSRKTIADFSLRRGAGVVERDGLENRCTGNRTVGSNPTLSANKSVVFV